MSESKEVTLRPTTAVEDFELIQRQAQLFMASGLFADTKGVAQAAVKIMAGRELGIGPFESMRDVNIIQGKTTLAAAQIAARIQRAGGRWTPIKFDANGCTLRFFEGGKQLTPDITFGVSDAKALGLMGKDNYTKQARTMFFWRAMTMGARMFFPSVFGGSIYTPDELRGALPEDLPEPTVAIEQTEAPDISEVQDKLEALRQEELQKAKLETERKLKSQIQEMNAQEAQL